MVGLQLFNVQKEVALKNQVLRFRAKGGLRKK